MSAVDLFGDIHRHLSRFIAYPSENAAVAHTLWIAHTHAMDAWEATARLAFMSPEPSSGKTRALEITENLVPRPVQSVNVSPAYLFRKVGAEDGRPTILFDEIDTIFGKKAKGNEEIRGLLNAGHRKGAVAGRCVVKGKQVETEEIPAYCAVALAGLDDLPDTIRTRSIIIRMRRRAPDEQVEPYRRRLHAPEGQELGEKLAAWIANNESRLSDALPQMPPEIVDRDADVWEPLFAVADLIGGDWPLKARVAAVTLVTDAKVGTPSLGIRLLADLREVFGDKAQLRTTDILECLNRMEEAPWGDIKGKAMDARGLSQHLSPYGVRPKTIRTGQGSNTAKGYTRDDLHDAWQRYLPKGTATGLPPDISVTSVTKDEATNDCTR